MRMSRGKDLRMASSQQQRRTEVPSPTAHGELNSAKNHVSELEGEPFTSPALKWVQLWPTRGCCLIRDPEPEAPAEPHLDTWPTETIQKEMSGFLKGLSLGVMCHHASIALKRKPQAQNGITHAKQPMIPNLDFIPDLTAVSASPRNLILVKGFGILWSGSSKVICPMGLLHPPLPHRKKRQSVW